MPLSKHQKAFKQALARLEGGKVLLLADLARLGSDMIMDHFREPEAGDIRVSLPGEDKKKSAHALISVWRKGREPEEHVSLAQIEDGSAFTALAAKELASPALVTLNNGRRTALLISLEA